jgi:hypothetical protein
MPKLGAALDFSQLEAIRLRAHQNNGAPVSPAPVAGQIYYDTGANVLYFYNGSTWVSASGGTPSDATAGSKGVIQLAGDLAGTAASPQIAAGVITDVEVAAANKDGATSTPSMRTLGFVAGTAMRGTATLDVITAANPVGADWSNNNRKITSLLDPTGAQDAATKNYVDTFAQGLDSHPSVKAASTANLTLSGTQTVDGIALVANDRILVKDQAAPAANGIYTVQSGAWTRVTDQDTWAEVPSAYVWVEQGTTQADTGWVCTADAGGTLGSTAMPWVLFGSAISVLAGPGLNMSGNTMQVNADNVGIEVVSDIVQLKNLGVTNAKLAGSIDVTTKITGAVPIANGGTGQTTAKTAREAGTGCAGYYSSATHGAGTTITITQATHGLRASRGLVVQTQDEATGVVEFPDVTVAANGDITVTYAVSQSANSKRVTVIG